MTAASYTTRPFAPPARTSLRWTLALLGVCVPVPVCAVSGLSLPLPATVERVAASLVPWADSIALSANEALHSGDGGSIVAATDERSGDVTPVAGDVTNLGTRTRLVIPRRPGAGVVPYVPGIPTVPGAPAPAAPDQGTGRSQPGGSGDPTPSAPAAPGENPTAAAPGESPAPAAPGESPTPAPGPAPAPTEPTQPPVQSNPDPVAGLKPVVDEVLAPVAPVVETVEKTLAPVVPVLPVPPVLPGLGK